MGERGSTSESIQTGSYRPEGYKPMSLSHKLKNALGVLIVGGGLATGCAPKEGIHPSQVPTMGGETPIATLVAPTEYVLPGVTTETSTVPTQAALETPPPQIDGVALVLPGIEPGAGGPDLIKNPLTSILQNAINRAGFGVVRGENVSSQAGQSCITAVPEKLWSDTLPNNEQRLKDSMVTDGVAKYDDTEVLAQVNLPADTKDATYSCALGYAVDNPDYKDGTLRQLLVKTDVADGSQEVVASMQAGFSTADGVEVKSDIVYVNGETQGWTAFEGMELPAEAPEFKAGIPETLAECNRLELQYSPDGTIDLDWEKEQMKALTQVEDSWLAEQGIKFEDVGMVGKTEMLGGAILPYPKIEMLGNPIIPVSCTTVIDASGQEYQMYGFAVRGSRANSNTITKIHLLYDHIGQRNTSVFVGGNSEYFDSHDSPELTLKKMLDRNFIKFPIFLSRYGQNDESLENWKMTKLLIQTQEKESAKLSNPQEQGATPSLMFFLGGKYEDIVPTAEDEVLWSKAVEEYIYPLQVVD